MNVLHKILPLTRKLLGSNVKITKKHTFKGWIQKFIKKGGHIDIGKIAHEDIHERSGLLIRRASEYNNARL